MLRWYVAAAAVVVSACSDGGTQRPPFKPIVDTGTLMESFIEPSADVIWLSVGTIVTAAGEEHIRPKTEEEWTNVRNAAVAVSEAGNLLMMEPRALDADEWMRLSQAMVDTGAEAIKAADAKDPDAMFEAGAQIYAVCSNCHAKYDPSISRVQ
jgi:mono/diheme cytochrome c family protein